MRVFFSGEDRNFDGDIRRRIGIENNAFQKLRKGNKDKRGEILCIRLQIYRIVVLKKDDENNLDRAYKKRGPFNENGSKKSTYTFPQFS